MPSRSPAQHRLMEAVAHNPAFAHKVGIPQKVGQDFATADRPQTGHKPQPDMYQTKPRFMRKNYA